VSVSSPRPGNKKRPRFKRHARVAHRRARRLPPVVRGMVWTVFSGLLFCMLNALLRKMTLLMDPLQAQFLRYLCGVLVMVPLVLRFGLGAFRPNNIRGQFLRGAVHAVALSLWFIALPHMSLPDVTSIGFTTPIFVMIGAALVLGETMRWDRWLASSLGFAGILLVVGPRLAGSGGIYTLVMLASAPAFAASFLITKALTRYESAPTIVLWQAVTVAALTFPFALSNWQWPQTSQWLVFLLCGFLGSAGHYCLTRAFASADISATQSVKFLDLLWASILGWIMFNDHPSQWTLMGGTVICGSTLWIARREAARRKAKVVAVQE
jgi:drug/metabolite transporter (DMT)-like permease